MSRPRILVAEDDAIISMEIAERLNRMGYEVTAVVPSGEDAISEAVKNPPDLILMDIRLRGNIDGTQAAGSITARMDVPVIYITAYTDEETRNKAQQVFSYGYIVKPFNDRQLLCAIDMAFSNHALHRKVAESEEKFRTLFENISDAAFLYDLTAEGFPGRILEVNDTALALLGLSRADLIGKEYSSLNDRCCQKDFPKFLEKLVHDGHVRYEMILSGSEGYRPLVEINAHVFHFQGKDLVISLARKISS